MNELFGVPHWAFAMLVGVPNATIGVLLLVFRRDILRLAKLMAPRLSEDAEFWLGRAIIVSGLFLIAVPAFLIYSAFSSSFGA